MTTTLFVVGTAVTGDWATDYAALSPGNKMVADVLTARGHIVSLRAQGNANKSLSGYSLGVLASDTTSSNLLGYLTQAVPLVILAHAVWDDAKLWAGGTNASTVTLASMIVTAAGAAHQIGQQAGLAAGSVDVFSPASVMRWVQDSNLTAGQATVLARQSGLSTSVTAWCYEAGALLADGVTAAQARRVATAPISESAQNATAALKAWLGAAADWAAGVVPAPTNVPVLLTPGGAEVEARYWDTTTQTWK